MIKLRVEKFSCIDEAVIVLAPVTVLVGPQASGKSVISKLTYFFINLLRDQFIILEEEKGINGFKDFVREKFRDWFPPSAWGTGKFYIEFEAGPYQVRLTRIGYKDRVGQNIRVTFSQYFEFQYVRVLESIRSIRAKANGESVEALDLPYSIRREARKNLASTLGEDYVSSQIFIPAGRSFFTSMGKAIVAFDHARFLDPLTAEFGRVYTSYKEWNWNGHRQKLDQDLMTELLGGRVRMERDKEFVETRDGRKIPFTALSSGQQEMMPLLITLGALRVPPRTVEATKRLIYIEEPEAHLFPSAQSALIQTLSSIVSKTRVPEDLMMTTHSPYVLAKLNNLIKAGSLAQKLGEGATHSIEEIIPQRAWLAPGRVIAYGIVNRGLISIIDEDGLIAADYLDDVSGSIAREFSALLAIEVANADR